MDNKFKSAIAFGGFILFVIIIGTFSLNENGLLEENEIIQSMETESKEEFSGEVETKEIYVHIIGAVNNPGIIKIAEDARLYQVIEQAGGLKENADESLINLAKIVNDEEQIIIPYKESSNSNVEETNVNKLFKDSNKESDIENTGKININTATKDELKTLTGIGESTAEKIIKYRNENSKFEKIEDITNVAGIGDSKFNVIKDKIVVK